MKGFCQIKGNIFHHIAVYKIVFLVHFSIQKYDCTFNLLNLYANIPYIVNEHVGNLMMLHLKHLSTS